VTSNLGYFITITYHTGDLASGDWGSPAQATLYKSSAPTTPLGRLTYSLDGTTITDLGGRVYTCTGVANALGTGLERPSGSLTLAGEASPTWAATQLTGYGVVGSVTVDDVAWNYAYANIQPNSQSPGNYLYRRVTVTGPESYNTFYDGAGPSLNTRRVPAGSAGARWCACAATRAPRTFAAHPARSGPSTTTGKTPSCLPSSAGSTRPAARRSQQFSPTTMRVA
jgi:hypothetical protein